MISPKGGGVHISNAAPIAFPKTSPATSPAAAPASPAANTTPALATSNVVSPILVTMLLLGSFQSLYTS